MIVATSNESRGMDALRPECRIPREPRRAEAEHALIRSSVDDPQRYRRYARPTALILPLSLVVAGPRSSAGSLQQVFELPLRVVGERVVLGRRDGLAGKTAGDHHAVFRPVRAEHDRRNGLTRLRREL